MYIDFSEIIWIKPDSDYIALHNGDNFYVLFVSLFAKKKKKLRTFSNLPKSFFLL